jgi:N6-L-threonylcarbamoyladenine synthase
MRRSVDEVAKLLGLGYPGVVAIASPAGQRPGDSAADHPADSRGQKRAGAQRRPDFSFSGLKTAVLRHVKPVGGRVRAPSYQKTPAPQEIADICASFQRVVVTALIDRVFVAARRHSAKSIGVAGGVSANSRLRADLQMHGERREIPTFLPSLQLSTDNAAMIAAAGLRKFRAGVTAPDDLNADAALVL